jgi:hypothetical protein
VHGPSACKAHVGKGRTCRLRCCDRSRREAGPQKHVDASVVIKLVTAKTRSHRLPSKLQSSTRSCVLHHACMHEAHSCCLLPMLTATADFDHSCACAHVSMATYRDRPTDISLPASCLRLQLLLQSREGEHGEVSVSLLFPLCAASAAQWLAAPLMPCNDDDDDDDDEHAGPVCTLQAAGLIT